MPGKIKFVFAMHNHQPVGNFDHVIASAFDDAYEPFVDVMERHPAIPFVLHFSGCLLEWMEKHQPDFCKRVAALSATGRLELMGGGYYEPILTMLPERDLLGQVRTYSAHLKVHYHASVRGAWVAERVWEQPLASSLAKAKIQYVALDDHHFKAAGFSPEALTSYFVTEDQGHTLSVFPMSERLRYLIPFASPEECIEHILSFGAEREEETLIVYADDGEKFGTWPGTHKLIYTEGWLERFLTLLEEHRDRIEVVTFSQALDALAPAGRAYLPDCSYREMTEWALPAPALARYEDEVKSLDACGKHSIASFLRGGSWRNFKTKYPEVNTLYARMLLASEAVGSIAGTGRQYMAALTHLFRGQCNCAYWHGVFGGLYLPHLRDAAYGNLIRAGQVAKSVLGNGQPAHITVRDLDLDARPEILLENQSIAAFFKPDRGAQLYELDLLDPAVNVINTVSRKPEAYHRALTEDPSHEANPADTPAQTIHAEITAKESDLERLLVYDRDLRSCLIDRILDPATIAEQMPTNTYTELADFSSGPYAFNKEKKEEALTVSFQRSAPLASDGGEGILNVVKKVTMPEAGAIIEVEVSLQNQSGRDMDFVFATELNFSMQSGSAPDRYYLSEADENLGKMDARLDLADMRRISLIDEWRRFRLNILSTRPYGLWTYPVETVSISEAGLERIFQAACLLPHWRVHLLSGQTVQIPLAICAEAWDEEETAGEETQKVRREGVPIE